jgi:hypothetical protein
MRNAGVEGEPRANGVDTDTHPSFFFPRGNYIA